MRWSFFCEQKMELELIAKEKFYKGMYGTMVACLKSTYSLIQLLV